jgi:hypothetical protein
MTRIKDEGAALTPRAFNLLLLTVRPVRTQFKERDVSAALIRKEDARDEMKGRSPYTAPPTKRGAGSGKPSWRRQNWLPSSSIQLPLKRRMTPDFFWLAFSGYRGGHPFFAGVRSIHVPLGASSAINWTGARPIDADVRRWETRSAQACGFWRSFPPGCHSRARRLLPLPPRPLLVSRALGARKPFFKTHAPPHPGAVPFLPPI